MKVYILMADGFEECEALVPADLLMRAGAEVVLTSITDRLEVRGAHGIRVLCDKAVGGFSIDDAAMVVLPGGGEGTENLKASVRVQAILDAAVARGLYIGAICAAPSILGEKGLLDGDLLPRLRARAGERHQGGGQGRHRRHFHHRGGDGRFLRVRSGADYGAVRRSEGGGSAAEHARGMTARGGGQLENKKKKAVRITSAPITVPLLAAAVIVMLGVSRFVLERQAENENNIFLVITVLQLIIFALPCMLYYFLKGRKLASPMYIAPVRPGHLIFIASALATLVTGNLLIKFFYYLFTGEAGTNGTYFAAVVDSAGTDTSTAMVLTALVFIPAVCEEFFFRGVVLAEYRQFGAVNAVVFSSLCFAMLHFSIENFPIYLFSGLMLGMVCAVCRSIFASIVLHVVSNAMSIYLSDLFIRVTIQKSGAFFVGFVLAMLFAVSLMLMTGRLERIYSGYAQKPPEEGLPPRSVEHLVFVYLSPAFFLLVIVFVLMTIFL